MYSMPVPTYGLRARSSGTAWRCMFDPINARLASSFSRNGTSDAATDTSCFGDTSMNWMSSRGASTKSPARRASQLEDLHHAMQDITSELGVAPMLEKLLGGLAAAIGTTNLSVELTGPPAVTVVAPQSTVEQPRSVLAGSGAAPSEDWTEVEWKLPLKIRGRSLGVMIARHVLPPGAKADEEQLLKIVADQVAIAAEIIATRWRDSGRRLTQTRSAIHHPIPEPSPR